MKNDIVDIKEYSMEVEFSKDNIDHFNRFLFKQDEKSYGTQFENEAIS